MCFQDSTSKENSTVNSEFENMWKDMLKGSSGGESSQGSSLSQAAASLPTVPSTATDNKNNNKNNNETASTKIDVENLFSQASKVQGNDEFSAMFKSLELSNQQKATAKDDRQETAEVQYHLTHVCKGANLVLVHKKNNQKHHLLILANAIYTTITSVPNHTTYHKLVDKQCRT